MSRLAVVHLFELGFQKFGHLKDGSQSCLAQSNPPESLNPQSIINKIQGLWPLGAINFQVFPQPHPLRLHRGVTVHDQILLLQVQSLDLVENFLGKNPSAPYKFFQPVHL